MPSGSFTTNAVIRGAGDFLVEAYVGNDRWRHDIINDHFDDLSTLSVVIEAPIGPHPAGTPLHTVLDDIVLRMIALESSNKRAGTFKADAYLLAVGGTVTSGGTTTGVWAAYSAIQGEVTNSFTADAFAAFAFSLDAVLAGYGEIGVNAVIV